MKEILSPDYPDAQKPGSKASGKSRRMPLKRQEWPRIRETRGESKGSRYVLDLRPHVYGKGSRLYFDNLEAAKVRAKELAIEHRNKGTESIDFPSDLRVDAAACHALLQPHGVTLRQAVDHYLAWLKDTKHRAASRIVKDCIADYLAVREMHLKTGELSPITIREIRTRMRQFEAAWGERPIMAITRATVKEYFENQQAAGMKPRSRINIRANMSAFFNHCVERGWIDHSPCVRIKIKVLDHEVSILTTEQAGALMKAASQSRHADKMVPYFAVCLFAGLRPTEATRLDWSRIRFEDGRIEIMKDTTKTRRRRWAKIEPNGLEWLRPYARSSGLLVGGLADITWKRQFNAIRIAAGLIPDPGAANEDNTPSPKSMWDHEPLAGASVAERIVNRAYQTNAVKEVAERTEKGHRQFLLVMATGTGKTRVAVALVELLSPGGSGCDDRYSGANASRAAPNHEDARGATAGPRGEDLRRQREHR